MKYPFTKKQRNKLYKLFLKQYITCNHHYVCDIFTTYFIKKGKILGETIFREDIIKLFDETKLFLISEDDSNLNFGDCKNWDEEPKTMGIIFFQLCIEMTK